MVDVKLSHEDSKQHKRTIVGVDIAWETILALACNVGFIRYGPLQHCKYNLFFKKYLPNVQNHRIHVQFDIFSILIFTEIYTEK